MGAFYDEIPNDTLKKWIEEQKLFFVATAPLSQEHHVNTSPKGHDTFHLVSSKACWYLDLTGSGNETVSHVLENGRITIMFAAVTGPPRIVRLFGTGKIYEAGTKEFEALIPDTGAEAFATCPRAIVWVDIHRVGTSCGYSVPYFDYKEDRMTLLSHFEKREALVEKGDSSKTMTAYRAEKNAHSMDGLPGLPSITSPNTFAVKNRLNRLDLGSVLVGLQLGLLIAGIAWWLAAGGREQARHWLEI